ncbi:hypothetical protein [Arenibacter nanhaiticus]|nr:hypothetical protein [Arenibacter nanhaiticus]
MMTLEKSVQEFIKGKKDYYQQWIFDEPIVISAAHNADVGKLQKIMYKLIKEFVIGYKNYKHLMPVCAGVEKVLDVFNQKEYNIGTYRTDFVYDTNNQVKLIEITCRFPLNGVFLSGLMDAVARETKPISLQNVKLKDQYSPIYKHLNKYLKEVTSICILKGEDVRNESKLYTDILKRTGLEVNEVLYTEIDQNFDKLEKAWVVSELSFDEILSFSKDSLKKLISANLINDFRTVFLIHDKRFFSVLGKKELQNKVLTQEEISFFEKFYIPTYTANEAEDVWKNAKENKNEWIIKHRALGKSQQIYAGLVTPLEEWDALFESPDLKDFILQKWIPQKTIKGTINGEVFHDFVTGTALFFDDHYFGFGDFRTSSHPVTNKVDHRKATGLILDQEIGNIGEIANYIP